MAENHQVLYTQSFEVGVSYEFSIKVPTPILMAKNSNKMDMVRVENNNARILFFIGIFNSRQRYLTKATLP